MELVVSNTWQHDVAYCDNREMCQNGAYAGPLAANLSGATADALYVSIKEDPCVA